MEWTKYTIRTTIEAEDIISSKLMDFGVSGIEIENSLPPTYEEFEAMYIDPEPELLPDEEIKLEEGVSLVSFYLRLKNDSATDTSAALENSSSVDDSYTIHDKEWSEEEVMQLMESIQESLKEISTYMNIGAGTIETEMSREEDWRNNWKDYFKPQIMGNIIIKPTWTDIPEEYVSSVENGDMTVIEMDPGTAFGTGSHETTRLCVNGLEKYLKPGQIVLDIGTGSGILGFCALSMGARFVMATELDPDCVHIIEDNMSLNNVSDSQFELAIGNIAEDAEIISRAESHGDYDIIVSNILAPVIVTLAGAGQADRFAKKGAIFITSGIINTREGEVKAAFENNPAWEILGSQHLGDWVSVIARRR